ncbi:glycosyltransferase [Larkinella soli]|uniref:glycosyltransferase n=1 Tax=Larkinella soli TaxID=1770527 RepID=UPI000FFC9A00|nr:glycosyltransferase family 4 protein [Larkinella soli]
MRKLNILIWHIHGAYLTALAQAEHNWYLPTRTPDAGGRVPEGYIGRGVDSSMPAYVQEVPADEVRNLDLDLILFQTPGNYGRDQYDILPEEQRQLPRIYLEHNTPEPHPTNSRHPAADDPGVQLVHVTYYNQLMWDNGSAPTRVIEHSVAIDPAITYRGHLPEGIAVVNEMQRRGRLSGYDLFEKLRQEVPLTVAGMKSAEIGGIGEIHYRYLHRRVADYRFLFSPMRYSSLPLAVIEAMTIGMPIVAFATTELPAVIQNHVHGFVSCNPKELAEGMRYLLDHPEEAKRMGDNARQLALSRFGIDRFVRDWNRTFEEVLSGRPQPVLPR